MLNDNEFIERVWSKYEVYSKRQDMKKDKFFTGKLYRNVHNMLVLKTCALFMLVVIATALIGGGTYAVINDIVKPKIEFIEEDAEIEDSNSLGYNYDSYAEGMEYLVESEIYYKKISNYEEYIKYKKSYNNFIDMQENEFEEYFLLIFLTRVISSTNKNGLYVDYVDVTEDTIYVDLGKKEYKDNPLVFVKLEKENDRENIEVKFLEKEPIMTNYVARDELPEDYSLEQAKADNCVVIENWRFTARQNGLKEFINSTENGTNGDIRIIEDSYYGIIITDIEFRDGEYIVCIDRSHMAMPYENQRIRIYFTSEKFEFEDLSERKSEFTESYYLKSKESYLGIAYYIKN